MTRKSATGVARPWFIGSEIYRRSTYGGNHPLAIPRVTAVMDLVRAMGWLEEAQYVDSPQADVAALARFHTPDYIAALMQAEADQGVGTDVKARYNIGANGNPVYREVFRRPATAAGASIHAAELLRDGGVVHSPAGGTHHGRPDRASGFCYFNDPVLGILAMLDQGLERIAYLDIDAHHGDGVQDAFGDDDRVLTISVHEDDRWPRTGAAADRAGGMARNFPVPAGFTDAEMQFLLDESIEPLIAGFAPGALVVQCGADSLRDDHMSKLALTNNAHRAVISALLDAAPRLLVLGGGGYNPWSTARCWAGIWAILNGIDIPALVTPAGESVLRGLWWNRMPGRELPEHWYKTVLDRPCSSTDVRPEIAELVSRESGQEPG